MGGTGSGSHALVEQHLTVGAETVVEEGDVFNIRFEGFPTSNITEHNGVCYVTIEYELAP